MLGVSVVLWLGRQTCDQEVASSTTAVALPGSLDQTQPSIPSG